MSRTPGVLASYATLKDGEIARTVEVGDDFMIDLDSEGCPVGVEVIGGGNWTDALVRLAMAGELRIAHGIKP